MVEDDAAKGEKYRQWTHKGTTYTLTEADYKKAIVETSRKLMGLAQALQSQYESLFEVQQSMDKTIQGGEGLMQAL